IKLGIFSRLAQTLLPALYRRNARSSPVFGSGQSSSTTSLWSGYSLQARTAIGKSGYCCSVLMPLTSGRHHRRRGDREGKELMLAASFADHSLALVQWIKLSG